MALSVKTGTFALNSALTAGQTLAITGVGFQPKVIFFFSNGRTDVSNAVGALSQRRMFGVAVDSTHRWVTCGSVNLASERSGNCRRSDCCIAHRIPVEPAGTPTNTIAFWNSAYDLTSMDADGFTLNVQVQALANYQISYIALGGSDITNIAVGGFTTKTSVGSQAITGVGFKPDFLLLSDAETGLGNVGGGGANFGPITGGGFDYPAGSAFDNAPTGVGFTNGTNTGVARCGEENNFVTPTDAKNYSRAGEIVACGSSFAGTSTVLTMNIVAALTSLDANGFTLNYTKVDADGTSAPVDFYYLAIKGIQTAVGTLNTRTDSNPIIVSGLSIAPIAVMLLSTCNIQTAVSGTYNTSDGPMSIGFFTGATARNAQGSRAQNGSGSVTPVDNSSIAFDKVYQNVSNSGTIQGAADVDSLNSDGFTIHMTTVDPQANFVHYIAFASSAPPFVDKTHNADAFIFPGGASRTHNADCFITGVNDRTHNADAFILGGLFDRTHGADAYILAPSFSYVRLRGNIIFPINPNAFVKLAGLIAAPNFQFVQLAGTIKTAAENAVVLAGTIQSQARAFVKLAGNISSDKIPTHFVDASISVSALSFVRLSSTIIAPITKGACGTFPDSSYVRLDGWIIQPNDSVQMPNEGFSLADDFLSSQDALTAYRPTSIIKFTGGTLPQAGVAIIITAFTAGVVSFQTRTRSWLTRVDEAPSGILLTTQVNTHTLPNGVVITTTTQVRQQQDTTITTVTTVNSATPGRKSVVVTEKNQSGQTTTREKETHTTNGVINSLQKTTVFTKPPTKDNIQPLQVRTLDGVIHFQFFGADNPEWAGGDREGVTTTTKQEKIIPGILNGSSTDPFGNNIYNKVTDETVEDPTGKVQNIHTEEIGTRRDVGTITTDSSEQFNGIVKTVHKVTTFPDGSQDVTDTSTNSTTGDTIEVGVETVTDEFGQTTTTTTKTETKTFPDPVTGALRQTITKTTTVDKGGVTTTDSTVTTSDDFEDSIVSDKIRVYFIQEFTLTCVIDEFSMMALAEVNITHQKNYALLELFGQQLGNAKLSFALRQRLIEQFNNANACLAPIIMQALGRRYSVVFAQSASSFRAKYIPGTEPHCYELQMIVQARSNLQNGTIGF